MTKFENQWKPVALDEAFFSEGVPQDLIGIEECWDYNMEAPSTDKKRKATKTPDTKKKKQKTQHEMPKKAEKENHQQQSLSPSKSGNTLISNDDSSETTELRNFDAWKGFDLPDTILKAIEEQGFEQPSEIQLRTLPAAILGKRDILGAAQTGSGKTLAFGLPILTGILRIKDQSPKKKKRKLENDNKSGKPLYALILTPTRELAMQIKNHLSNIAKYTGIQIAVIVGGMAPEKQQRILSKEPEIVVATPGRLWELIQQGNAHLSKIDEIKFLTIDETDRMLERDHFHELHNLLEKINMKEENKQKRQNFVFSATLTLVHDLPKHLLMKKWKGSKRINNVSSEQKLQGIVDSLGVTNPKVVDLSEGKGTSETLTECRITCAIDEKDHYVFYFLRRHPGRTIIFCNSIGCVKRLANLLNILECQCLPLHANMQQRQRLKNLDRFRETENSILIATDVAARGLDIPMIDHVLHYQTPRTSESYVHRSGRTARASKQGITVLLMEPNEFKNYTKLCKTLNKSEDLPIFPVDDKFLNAVKKIVKLARELDTLQLQVRKANAEDGWLQKAAREMDIVVDGITHEGQKQETGSKKKLADFKRKQLSALLASPIFPRGFSGKFPFMTGVENLSILNTNQETNALEVMKKSLENAKKNKSIPLYKPKKKGDEDTVFKPNIIRLNKVKNINLKKNKNKNMNLGKNKKKIQFKR